MLISVNLKEWQYKDIVDEKDNQVVDRVMFVAEQVRV